MYNINMRNKYFDKYNKDKHKSHINLYSTWLTQDKTTWFDIFKYIICLIHCQLIILLMSFILLKNCFILYFFHQYFVPAERGVLLWRRERPTDK